MQETSSVSTLATLSSLAVLLLLTLPIAIIDWQKMIIPDRLNLLLAISGLLFSCLLPVPGITDSISGLLAGGALSWSLRHIFFQIRKIEGLGLGDVKFMAAAGGWTGSFSLPPMLLLASCTALLYYAFTLWRQAPDLHHRRLPFAPFLCIALVLVAGAQIISGNDIYAIAIVSAFRPNL